MSDAVFAFVITTLANAMLAPSVVAPGLVADPREAIKFCSAAQCVVLAAFMTRHAKASHDYMSSHAEFYGKLTSDSTCWCWGSKSGFIWRGQEATTAVLNTQNKVLLLYILCMFPPIHASRNPCAGTYMGTGLNMTMFLLNILLHKMVSFIAGDLPDGGEYIITLGDQVGAMAPAPTLMERKKKQGSPGGWDGLQDQGATIIKQFVVDMNNIGPESFELVVLSAWRFAVLFSHLAHITQGRHPCLYVGKFLAAGILAVL